MTGCEPTEVKCNCNCHTTGLKTIKTSLPEQPCCECETGIFMINNNPKKCKHGILEWFGCYYCDLEKRIEALEKNQQAIILNCAQRINSLECQFTALELNDLYKELESIHSKVNSLQQERDKGVARLKDLEEWTAKFIDTYENNLCHCQEKLDTLEESYQGLKKEVDWLHDESFIQKMFYQYEQRLEALESNLSQQNSVIVKAQDGIEIENSHLAPKIECKRCDKLLSDGLHTCAPKTVTIYEAIKAFREGKEIRRPHWYEDFCLSIKGQTNCNHCSQLMDDEDLLADDWVIEDE